MRRFLIIIMAAAIVAAVFALVEGTFSTSTADYYDNDTLEVEADVFEEFDVLDNNNSDYIPKNKILPLAESGNIKVYEYYGLKENDRKYGDDFYAKDGTYLIRYVDDIPKDSLILVGPYSRLLRGGDRCRIVVGVDTVNVDIKRPFRKTLDLRFRDAIPGCKHYRLSRHYSFNDSACNTDFQINIAMRDSTPLFIKDFISEMIRDDVEPFFNRYRNDGYVTTHVPMIRMRNRTVEQMMEHYYYQFRKFYDKEFKPEPGSDERAIGQHYSYQYYAYPVWQNSDSTLTTWKFYSFNYTGGAHGYKYEYFLTFDNATGRFLGKSDFFSKKDFDKAIDRLAERLDEYFDATGYAADLNSEYDVAAMQSSLTNEVIDGKIYPRPAITNQGIVFSYQTYEKGGNSDGVLHFTVPFKKDFHLKK